MRRISLVSMLMLGFALVVGCAKPPEQEIQAAKKSVEDARAEAGEYAPQAFREAEDALAALETELQVQEEKFSLFRSYKDTNTRVAAVKTAADKAAADARAGKETARTEASDAIASARMTIDETKTMVDNAPAGKGTAADIAALKSDLAAAESTLMEADAAQSAGRFKEAKAKASAAKSNAEQVKMAVEQAMQARSGGTARRS